jgi:hypothetical protein
MLIAKNITGIYYLTFIIAVFIFTGCKSSSIVNASELRLMRDFCVSPAEYNPDWNSGVLINPDSLLNRSTLISRYFSRQDIIMANATTTLTLIQNLLSVTVDSSFSGQISYLKYNNQFQQKIQLMRITIDAFSAEIECEITRTREISAYLTNLGKRGNTRLTAAAITAGAITTLAPVWVNNKALQNTTVVSGGLTSVMLAILTLHPGNKKVKLMHKRNLLADIWYQNKRSSIYPAGLWYVLGEKQLSNTPSFSKIQIVKMRWVKFYLNNNISSPIEELLFRNGGIYDVNNLELRASMLSELKLAIGSINQNLQHFVFNLTNVLSAKNLLF